MAINPRWIVAIVMLFVLCTVASNTAEMVPPMHGSTTIVSGNMSNVTTVLDRLTIFGHSEYSTDIIQNVGTVVNCTLTTLGALWDILWWNYSFFDTDNFFVNLVRYAILFPLSIAFMFAMGYILRNIFSPR